MKKVDGRKNKNVIMEEKREEKKAGEGRKDMAEKKKERKNKEKVQRLAEKKN